MHVELAGRRERISRCVGSPRLRFRILRRLLSNYRPPFRLLASIVLHLRSPVVWLSTVEPGRLDHLSYGQLRNLCKQHGYHREDAKDVLNTRFASMQDQPAIGSTQNFPVDVAKPSASAVKRGRPPADVAEHLQGPTLAPGKRCRIRKNIGNTRAPGERPLW